MTIKTLSDFKSLYTSVKTFDSHEKKKHQQFTIYEPYESCQVAVCNFKKRSLLFKIARDESHSIRSSFAHIITRKKTLRRLKIRSVLNVSKIRNVLKGYL